MKYIIFGHKGQLGRAFTKLLTNKKIDWLGYDFPDYDICNYVMMNQIIEEHSPDVIINCAAYSNVDAAELDYEKTYQINTAGPLNLAVITHNKNIKLVHYSTDYVFDGLRNNPGLYTETDKPNPVNNYGRTKLHSENLTLEKNPDTLILRLSWLYGDGTNNFLYKLLQWSHENRILKIVNDEISIPTSTTLVALTTLLAINNNLSGIYHLTSTGYCSRYEWAKLFFKLIKSTPLDNSPYDNIIYPCKSDEFFKMTPRPMFSALDNSKLCDALQIELPHWDTDLNNYINNLIHEKTHQHPNLKRIRKDIGITFSE